MIIRSQARSLLARTWLFVLAICLQLLLATASIYLLSGTRIIVAGESTWSKAQKDAILYLDRYAAQGDEEAYQQFRQALEIPLGDRLARLALDRSPTNTQQVREGLLRGEVHSDDIGTATDILRLTWDMEWMRKTIGLWRAADTYLDQLVTLSMEIRTARTTNPRNIDLLQRRAWHLEISHIDASIAPLSQAFSDSLGVHSRRITQVLLAINFGTALLLISAILWFVNKLLTQSHTVENALHSERERGYTTLAALGDGVLTLNDQGLIVYANPAAEILLGQPADILLGQALEKVLVFERTELEGRDPVFVRLMESPHPFRDEAVRWIRRSNDQQQLAVKLMGSPIQQEGQLAGAVLVLHDVTREQNFMHQLNWQSRHDTLTGLENRSEFRTRLERLLSVPRNQSRPATLLHLDLDQFKLINDTSGYTAGDEVLREVCHCISRLTRDSDSVARLGGDEFAVLLHDYTPEQASVVAEKLRHAIQSLHLQWGTRILRTGVSIGMVHISGVDACAQDLLRMADMACLRAKESGRNKVLAYEHEDHAFKRYMGEMDWVERIRTALDQNRFCLFAQTLAPLQTRAEHGLHFEVLLRMTDEHGQIIPPGNFIPAAERYGLMPALDRWVVTHALHTLARYPKQLREIHTCAINLSGMSLGDESLLGFLQQQIEEFHVPPQILCFEITETNAIANLDNAIRLITELKALGCRFSLDDFGAGMSSFNYLKRLPVDYLKIDGGFVHDMLENPSNFAMVAMINQIGHMMGKRTVAEFVENEATIDALRKMGVDYGQGFCIAKPMPWNYEYFAAASTQGAKRFGTASQDTP
ncbi:EAL domain-containing protein [Comamonas terrigena]|uniref:EAL domain-containing protein n=1 Tax=Comamonas terrigena TaxID=32013 RepID=UPI00244A4269|nr:EAL domain-containing protein [Comamonas terrigena]MDH0049825.1 EAL domain-containing protein [Comamonas terrigena]MDH0512411.1 EAL domain-containing protein [Comamonas terrigena]MDH1091937.1 EAL domain-containing protein [Comamonas terrigena]MDH1501239.1 EAL domain-containing protein [Comamonas terrigena]